MLFLAVLIALVAAVVAEYLIYGRRAFDRLAYRATFSESEVAVGDDVYLFEEIRNDGHLPIPFLKVDTDLPEGLEFTLIEVDRERGGRKIASTRSIQSIFVLHSNSRIRRRWRVRAKKRGEYRLGGVVVSVGDVLGLNTVSRRLEIQQSGRTSVVVLPAPRALCAVSASSRLLCGDLISALCPVTDPQIVAGTREYTVYDPMNRINWKSTAIHAKLMVNIEERTVRPRFSVLLNMNSRQIEQRPDTPSDPASVERGITLAASLLDRIAAEEVPARLFVNAPPPDGSEDAVILVDDGGGISVFGPWRGRARMVDAMRTLARLPMAISVTPEKMFDLILSAPHLFGENENLIVVSPYIDGRMINFKNLLRERGVRVVFYITSARNTAGVLPPDTYFDFG